jgi:hypothetical protein
MLIVHLVSEIPSHTCNSTFQGFGVVERDEAVWLGWTDPLG